MLEDSVTAIRDRIRRMPVEEVRRLGQLLQKLDPKLAQVMRETSERALVDDRLNFGEHRFYEHFFETWWTHTLETKLAAVTQIASLASPGTWPDDVLQYLPGMVAPGELDVTVSPC